MPQSGYQKKFYDNLPPELVSFYESENIPYEKIPPHDPECTRTFTADAPVITSPTDGMKYILEENSGQQLMLSCNADNEVKTVYWYVNNKFYKKASAHDHVFFSPTAGEAKISCTDDKGRNTNVTIAVALLN